MATVTALAAQSYTGVPGHGLHGTIKAAVGVYEISSALSTSDIIQFCKLPAGAVVVGGWLYGDDIDTGTEAFELDIGTTDDTDQFLNSGVITGDTVADLKLTAGILLPLQNTLMSGGPQLFTSETTVIGTVVAAANSGGTGTLTVVLYYFVDPNWSAS